MLNLKDQAAPELNVEIYCLLYEIEVGIRELIVSALSSTRGNGWAKQSLPPDVLEKYRSGKSAESASPWTQFIPHHPIYYVDFPDLVKVIESGRNWGCGFEKLFKRREIIVGTLRGLEPIRNKIAHNRVATSEDLAIVRSAKSQIASTVGELRFAYLARQSTMADDAPQKLSHLRSEATSVLSVCLALEKPTPVEQWSSIQHEWWFDSQILGHDLEPIESFFTLIEQYAALPRARGSGYEIEHWVRSSKVKQLHQEADAVLGTILDEV